jgi:hypothetical protein
MAKAAVQLIRVGVDLIGELFNPQLWKGKQEVTIPFLGHQIYLYPENIGAIQEYAERTVEDIDNFFNELEQKKNKYLDDAEDDIGKIFNIKKSGGYYGGDFASDYGREMNERYEREKLEREQEKVKKAREAEQEKQKFLSELREKHEREKPEIFRLLNEMPRVSQFSLKIINPKLGQMMKQLEDLRQKVVDEQKRYEQRKEHLKEEAFKELEEEMKDEEEILKNEKEALNLDQEAFKIKQSDKKEKFNRDVIANADYRLKQMANDAKNVNRLGATNCASNVKSREQIEHEAYEEEKKKAEKAEEDEAKNITPDNPNGSGRKMKRTDVVKNIMKKKGLSMIEASKYVKSHNLY